MLAGLVKEGILRKGANNLEGRCPALGFSLNRLNSGAVDIVIETSRHSEKVLYKKRILRRDYYLLAAR